MTRPIWQIGKPLRVQDTTHGDRGPFFGRNVVEQGTIDLSDTTIGTFVARYQIQSRAAANFTDHQYRIEFVELGTTMDERVVFLRPKH